MAKQFGLGALFSEANKALIIDATSIADWDVVGVKPSVKSQRATAPNVDGDVSDSELYDEKTEIEVTLKCIVEEQAAASTLILGGDGLIVAAPGYVCTAAKLALDPVKAALLTLSCHKHGATAVHTAQKYSVVLPKCGMGIIECPVIATMPSDLASASFGATCQHVDELGGDGETAIGKTHNAELTCEASLVKDAAVTIVTGWDVIDVSTTDENTEYERVSYRCVKNQVKDA